MISTLSIAPVQISDSQLDRFARLVYQRTGICLGQQRRTLLACRVRQGAGDAGDEPTDVYLRQLERLKLGSPEWDAFLRDLVPQETFFFRDEEPWRWVRDRFLPEVARTRRLPFERSLRIWSAATATGDEAFSAACCVAGALNDLSDWQIEIVGTDIDSGALEQAQAAVFSQRALQLVPEADRRWFIRTARAALWQARPELTRMVVFRQHNLLTPLRAQPFDLVLLKHVLHDFDEHSKAAALRSAAAALRPGGYLLVDAAAGAAEVLSDFESVEPWLLRRPNAQHQNLRTG